ncbi:MAG: hypothetical protein K0S44_1479 [Bacteroidetes bacterium]|jgi:hypothetical protein|nr:hypothetical protein [Bacteroidota bacterium]
MKAVFGFLFFLYNVSNAFSQTDSTGTFNVRKSNCQNFNLKLAFTKSRDTITVLEVNKSFGFRLELMDCKENLIATIESYDITVNNQAPLHFTKTVVPHYTFKVRNEGILKVTNCIVKIDKPDRKQKRIVLPEATFYIVPDSFQD